MTTYFKLNRTLGNVALGVALMSLNACNSDNGIGTVAVTTWGEDYIESGLPSSVFPADHWSVKYSKFLVVYHNVTIADADDNVAASLDHPFVFDMTQKAKGTPKTLANFELDAQSWPKVSYQVGPISNDATAGDLASDDDVALLQKDGASVHVEGMATAPNGDTKTFKWSFSPATLFRDCHGEKDGKELYGVLVTNGGTQEVELTVHGDHLFYDDLQSEEAVPRFQAYADADANTDGDVTLAEMDTVPLYTIPPEKGTYGTGALGSVNTLGQYVRTLARTIGHYRGEGSCNSKEVE
jgi:hypothetical protein